MIIRKQTLRLLLFDCLAVLLLLSGDCAAARRRQRDDDIAFAFTAPVYNVTLEENARGTQFAISEGSTRMGVPLPDPDSTVRFKVVEHHSDKRKNDLFKAHAKQVGDFVFLRIRQKDKHDTPLNRELKDSYEFHVKATCKRKDAANLETTTLVKLRITDQNDAGPMFTLEADRYEATISDKIPPFSDVLQLEASDADIGINGQIYYSLVNRSSEFFVDPVTGWIRTLKPIRAGVYDLRARVEDRTSRIFYEDEEQKMPERASDVQITVTESKKVHPKLLVETSPIDSFLTSTEQLAALITFENDDSHNMRVGLLDDDFRHWFHLNQSEDESKWQLYTVPGRIIPDGTNVTVSAGPEMGASGNVTANIKISLLSRHGLSFSQSKISFTVDESAPLGFVIGNVAAKSINPNDTKLIRYHIESLDQNTTLTFRLHEEFGTLREARQLDYDITKLYSFNVIAKLTGFGEQSSILVEVHLTDANNHSPIIPAKWARQGPIAILPGTKIGTSLLKISAHDRDAGVNGKVGYKLSSEKETPFKIDFSTGDTPSKPKPVLSSEPANSHSPVFSPVSKITVREDAEIGTIIGTISASDSDLGYNGFIRYSTWDEYFSLNLTSGEISVAKELKSLARAGQESTQYEFEVIASDRGDPPKTAQQKVTVEIQDVNNNAPEFDQPWYRIRLSEDTAFGTVVLQVKADDDDAGESGRVAYKLPVSDDDHFSIDETSGKITLQKSLDRETNDVITYTIVAYDHGSPQQMSFVNFTVEVTDVNDNAPYCIEQLTKIRISEDYPDGALVGCIAARDDDTGANGRLRYSIETPVTELEGHAPFRIDHHTGCVFIHSPHRPLDYQIKNSYNLTIDVSDNGESMLSTTCNMVIQLIDIDENLHAPEFDDVAHEASVYENMPIGTEVFTVLASDADDKNAKLQYSIVGGDGQGYFGIDLKGVIRTLSVLDREKRWKYWLAVQATDDAPRSKSAILHLFVRVLDRNDHRPMTQLPIYFARVKENSPQNTVVVKLDATDGDDLDGKQQQLTFRIKKGDPQSFFRIDQNTGYITTSGSRKLDREAQREHELWISVCDSGEPQLCTDVPVIVTIQDVNDNVPVFTQPIHHYNVPAGVKGVLARVFAVDADAGINAELYYNITDGDARFTIDEHGTFSTVEANGGDEVYPLTIQVTDRGLPAQLAQTRVVLTGTARAKKTTENRAPKIKDSAVVSPIHISDADQVGLTVAMLEASDEDGDSLWWSIKNGNVNQTFAIRPDSGALMLAKPIEYLPSGMKRLNLTLAVSDFRIVIQLARSPTSRPTFTAQHYRTQISEKTAIGTQIYTVKATGEDIGPTTKPVLYTIFNVEDTALEDKLRIEPGTGNVLVMESLDFEAGKEIRAIVQARQGQLKNFATLTVGLTDDNDNAPQFSRKEKEVKVDASSPVGSIVTTIMAHDVDSGDNGKIKYTIVSGNELCLFSLNSATGIVRVAKSLNEAYGESILTVKTTDSGKYPLSDTATIRIIPISNDTGVFRFSRVVYHRSIRESTPIGSIILVVSTEPNGQAEYEMQQPCPYFDVHPLSGAVSLSKWLTRERAKSVECTVLAKTRTGDIQDTAKIIIRPTNTNQHRPVFKQQIYRGFIRENAPSGSSVLLSDNSPLVVFAVDMDAGPNALVGYHILTPNEPYFVVDYVSGAVRTRKPMDYEKIKEWSFSVQARDMGLPVKSSPVPALVIVTVLDENDQAPVFSNTEYNAKLILPTVVRLPIVKVDAADDDTVGQLKYYIKNKTISSLFTVNATDGTLLTATGNSSAFIESNYKIPFFVTDGSKTTSTTVNVQIVKSSSSKGFRCAQLEYTILLTENTTFTEGQHLLAVTAIGLSDGIPVVYRMITSRDEFILNSGTGVISLTGIPLDIEVDEELQLLIEAKSIEPTSQISQCVVKVKAYHNKVTGTDFQWGTPPKF